METGWSFLGWDLKNFGIKSFCDKNSGGLGGEGTVRGGSRRENSSGRGDKKSRLAGYCRTGDASGLTN